MDLLDRRAIDLSNVEVVVLDEADEMLSMGFADDLETILATTPEARQTALLSATLPRRIRHIAGTYLNDPETITTTGGDKTAQDVEQRGYVVHGRDKLQAMIRLLETEDVTSALAFVKTRAATTALAADLTRAGWPAEPISGELSQAQRNDVLHRFRNGDLRILVGTDVAARGLDVDHISHVFNVDLPVDIEAYVHRVGRTGRAGRSGTALSLVSPGERGLIERIQRFIKREIPATPLPSIEDVEAKRAERLGRAHHRGHGCRWRRRQDARDAARRRGPRPDDHRRRRARRRARGPRRDASGGDRQPAPPQRAPRHPAPRQRSRPSHHNGSSTRGAHHGGNEPGMVRVALAAGRMNGVEPRHVVSAVARTADIPGRALGKILITDRTTFVDVPQEFAGQVLAQPEYRFGKRLARVEKA